MQTQEEEFNRATATGRFPMIEALAEIPDFDLRLDDLFEVAFGCCSTASRR